MHYRSKWMDVKIDHEKLYVVVTEWHGSAIWLILEGKTYEMDVGDSKTITFKKKK